MRAKPKRFLHSGLIHTTWGAKRQGIWIECEITAPPSSAGKTITLHLDEDDYTALLLELRDLAARDRSKHYY
jgi:hypothetical protein